VISSNDKGKPYYQNYLKNVIYDPYNEIIIPKAYPGQAAISMNYKMLMTNAEPVMSQAEILKILQQPANPGLQNFKNKPGPKKISFGVMGAGLSHGHFNDLKAKILNPTTLQKAVQQKLKGDVVLWNYIMEIIDNPQQFQSFQTIQNGTYYLVLHRNAAYHHRKAWTL
jgi:hypothetical protein